MERKRVYIAGPMRGIERFNFPAFDAAAGKWQAAGWEVVNPADLDREAGFDEYADPATITEAFIREAMERDTAAICRCTAIALLPGWEKSEGVKAELALAKFLKLDILDADTMRPVGGASKPTNPKDAIGSNKVPLHLWPATASALGSMALLEGAVKYGRSNFRAIGVRASIYCDALHRHMGAWWEGEDNDPDSGLPHLAHALACLAIIVDAGAAGKLTDDRAYPGGYRGLLNALTPHVARLKTLHADKSPEHFTIASERKPNG